MYELRERLNATMNGGSAVPELKAVKKAVKKEVKRP